MIFKRNFHTVRASIEENFTEIETQKCQSTARAGVTEGNLRSSVQTQGATMAKGAKQDPTTMRRAGRPSVEPRKGPPSMTGFADQSARHRTMARSLVRPAVRPNRRSCF